MDQEDTVDFKTLRAKFQDEELLLKQPRIKPALPEKPKVVPPPHSPTYHLPAGARPSLLTSINQSLEGKTPIAPRVVFKDDKKESKKPLIQSNSKGKERSEGKLKGSKDKTKGSKEKPAADGKADLLDQKQKPGSSKDKKFPLVLPVAPKEATAELVPATPPPKATTSKKKGFLGFRKSVKKEPTEAATDPILDVPSPDVPGLTPLIPVPSGFGNTTPEAPAETETPKALLPPIPTTPDSNIAAAVAPPSPIPDSPDINSPPAFIPDIPAPKVPSPENETPPEIETPSVSPPPRPATPTADILTPPSPVPSPPLSHTQLAASTPPPASSPSPPTPEPDAAAVAGVEVADTAAVESPTPPVTDPVPSPKSERAVSALSFLERAEEMSPGKRTTVTDPRILNALEKARRKTSSPQTNNTTSYSVTPPPEELPPRISPASSVPELPPIDYEDQKPVQVNGIDHRQASPVSEGIAEERPDPIPELLVVPPPPPRKTAPKPPGQVPEKPPRPPTVNMSASPLPTLEDNAGEIAAPPEFSEAHTSLETPEFEGSDAYSLELPATEWGNGEYAVPNSIDGHTLPETMNQFYSNGITTPEAEVHGEPEFGVEFQDIPPHEPALDSSSPVSQDIQPIAGPQAEDGTNDAGENMYEDIISPTTKKKAKSEGGKKRKGPPKNPYAETPQPTNEEKSKTGRFGKNDKKAASEGPDEKELKKKEKQRLEKEKKELKEQKEREKKEQKEREKRESEMKKKFKITGVEEAMYQAKVTVTTKGRKTDLPVNSGDIVSIIRTTNCPKGKWLARDSSNNYGYIAVDHVELDIKEMLELGKKAAITRKSNSNLIDPEVASTGSRASNHYPLSTGSFTDDSEEWICDDDELPSSPMETVDPLSQQVHIRTHSMPDMGNKDLSINHQHSHSDISAEGPHMQARHEALQKLATFFHSPKPEVQPTASSTEAETGPVHVEEEAAPLPESGPEQELDSELPDMLILPPPDLYADIITGD